MQQRSQWLLIAIMFLAPAISRAEDVEEGNSKLRPRTRTAARGIDSYGNYVVSRGEGRARSAAKEGYEVHFGAAGGISTSSATEVDPGVSNLALNAIIDARAFKYFGLEADIHGDLVSAKYTNTNSTAQSSRTSRDFLFAAKGQYPFWAGRTRIIPKLGGGYGYTASQYSNPLSGPGAGSADAVQVTEAAGFFGLLGVDIEVTPATVFFLDYAMSMGATGAVSVGNQTVALTGAGFNRARLGGYYRLGDNWGLGGVVLRRALTYDSTGTSGAVESISNVQLQFLGMVMFEL